VCELLLGNVDNLKKKKRKKWDNQRMEKENQSIWSDTEIATISAV